MIAVTVDEEKSRAENARDIAGWIRRGYTVERVTIEEARSRPMCDCRRHKAVLK